MRPLPVPPPALPRPKDLTMGTFVGLAVTFALLIGLVPKFMAVFGQVKVRVPTMTALLFDLSSELVAEPWLAAVLLVSMTGSVAQLRGRQVSVARAVMPWVLVAIWLWILVALFGPLTGLLEGVRR